MFNLTPWKRKDASSGGSLAAMPEHPVGRLWNEVDSLFGRFFGNWPALWDEQQTWGLDIADEEKEMIVRAEAPGFEVGDFDLQLSAKTLTITAERKHEQNEGKNGHSSFEQRSLKRFVTLPAGVDPDKVEAHYRNGVLEVRVAKSPEALGRRIEVKA